MEGATLPPSCYDGTTGFALSFWVGVSCTCSSPSSPSPSPATGGRGATFARTGHLGLDQLGQKHTPAGDILCGRGWRDRRPTQRANERKARPLLQAGTATCSGRSAGGIQR